MKIVKTTQSYCNICLEKIPAKIIEKNNKIKIEKTCRQHGMMTSNHIWSDPEEYHFFNGLERIKGKQSVVMLDVTSRCNLYCPFCFVEAGDSKEKDVGFDKIKEVNTKDCKTVQITGGEPTLRKDLPEIIRLYSKKGKRVVILSNGIKLADKDYVTELKKSGLNLVVLQFDTFKKSLSKYMRNKALIEEKFRAISNLSKNNVAVSLFVVLLPGMNIKEMPLFKKLIIENREHLKIIYFSTLIKLGRYKKNKDLEISKIFGEIEKRLGLQKKDFYSTTEFIFNFSRLFKKKYFSKCALINMFLVHNSKIIPINRIFNLEKINVSVRNIKKRKYSSVVWLFFMPYLLFSELFLNYFLNRNYRLLVSRLIKNLRTFSFKNKDLLNPFATIYVGKHQDLGNIDLEFESSCYKRFYSFKDREFKGACCSYYIKK